VVNAIYNQRFDMNSNASFHEVRFPTDLALGSSGGPIRRTEVITLGSGKEQRNARWAHSRRRYNAGYGVKTIDDLQTVVEFFEERRGRLYGFRFRDPLDNKSSKSGEAITALDQIIGFGDGNQNRFQLVKRYGDDETGYVRRIHKPLAGSLVLALDEAPVSDDQYLVDWKTGIIEFDENTLPEASVKISAGFEFDVPVRFDADEISINLTHFEVGDIPSIPLVELLL
jgi:uncharacterized protein (TIGR02217 family)